jgi:hypothetical protein
MTQTFEIGRVFTPLRWAIWLIEASGAFRAWRDGAAVLDPTCGDGVFLEAFVALARRDGLKVTPEAAGRLHGVEIVAADAGAARERIRTRWSVTLADDAIRTADFVTAATPGRYDIVVGNPPWLNFADLPAALKAAWAPAFVGHGLVTDRRDVLLGMSRADVAALVVKRALDDVLADGGVAAFFIPLSMFFNSGANDRFRPFPASAHRYRVVRLWDFGREAVFAGVATRFGAALFDRKGPQTWPVETRVRSGGGWTPWCSTASDRRSGAWLRHAAHMTTAPPTITVSPTQKPRQGVNTCGANDVFIFEREGSRVRNGFGEEWELEEELLFPLMNAASFVRPLCAGNPPAGAPGRKRSGPAIRRRWILLPHDRGTGRPLGWPAIARYQGVAAYLSRHRDVLMRRKGTLINSHIGRGLWWALLGVGPYSFAPWKVAWEALGKRSFTPAVLEGHWQGNQALHAFCPCCSLQEADALAAALSRAEVESWLKSSAMAGTCNWAQPGRIGQLLGLR